MEAGFGPSTDISAKAVSRLVREIKSIEEK
jgi:hypothetical protein